MIKTVENKIVFTSPVKPNIGDTMLCFAHGIFSHRDKKHYGRKWFLAYHDDSNVARLNAICAETEKVNLIIELPILKNK